MSVEIWERESGVRIDRCVKNLIAGVKMKLWFPRAKSLFYSDREFSVGMTSSLLKSLMWVTTLPLLSKDAAAPASVSLAVVDDEIGEDRPDVRLAASWILRIFVVCPIPSWGKPLFSPSSNKHALHSSLDDMYPQRVQVDMVGSFVDSFAWTDAESASPEWMISTWSILNVSLVIRSFVPEDICVGNVNWLDIPTIAVLRMASRSFKKTRAWPRYALGE